MSAQTNHHTDYPVYKGAEECGHPAPEDEESEAYEQWASDHPEGEGLDSCVQICELSPIGIFCQDCSHDQGDWTPHLTYCDDCGYPKEDDGGCCPAEDES